MHKIRSDAAEIKKDSYLEQSKIRKDNGIMINTAPNKIELPDFGKVRQCRTNLSQIQMFWSIIYRFHAHVR